MSASAPVAPKQRAVLLDWVDACELRDWLIHAKTRHSANPDTVLYQSVADAHIAVICSLRPQGASARRPSLSTGRQAGARPGIRGS